MALGTLALSAEGAIGGTFKARTGKLEILPAKKTAAGIIFDQIFVEKCYLGCPEPSRIADLVKSVRMNQISDLELFREPCYDVF